MKKWKPNRLIAILLSLWIGLIPSLYSVAAAAMTLETGISISTNSGGCDNCPDTDLGKSTCALLCLNAASTATLSEPAKLPGTVLDLHLPAPDLLIAGLFTSPDPDPPKPVYLG